MSTDIGIGLARLIDIVRGREDRAECEATMVKLRLHIGTVFSFLGGGVGGVLAWRWVGDLSFAIAGLLLGTHPLAGADPQDVRQRFPV